jgi:fimbrial chaperone protein
MRAFALAILALSCLCGAQSRAQMLEVAPVSIGFAPEQRTASLTITNRGSAPTIVQIRPFMWRETDGVSDLTDTTALAASPPFAEIAPGQSQVVRLLLRNPTGASEATYRLLIDQLPPKNSPGIHVALRLSLPVFAQPSAQSAAALDWRVVQGRSGAELGVLNRGNRHATIIGAQLSAPNGALIPIRTAMHPYVLPGATQRWAINNARLPNGGAVRLTFTSDTGVQEATASVVSAPP